MPAESSQVTIAARWRVLRAIDELVGGAGELLAPRVVDELRAGRARLAQARFNLAVLGEFKRGKSTLINALLGRDVLPTGVLPLTSAVTVVRHGPRDRLIVRYRDGREAEHSVSELARFATELGNPGRVGVPSACRCGAVRIGRGSAVRPSRTGVLRCRRGAGAAAPDRRQ